MVGVRIQITVEADSPVLASSDYSETLREQWLHRR